MTNASLAMASQTAATARMAPAMMAMPLPMKSRVIGGLGHDVSPFDGGGCAVAMERSGQTVMATFPRAWPWPTWSIAWAVWLSG